MTLLIALLMTTGLLAGIIYLLRNQQLRALNEAAEREQPLPPLPQASDTAPQKDTHKLTAEIESPAPRVIPLKHNKLVPGRSSPSSDWKSESLRLRQLGEYEAALSECEKAWPQWQSFQQSALIIRAALRDGLDEGTPKHATNSNSLNTVWLERLYLLAARASFLHDKVAGLPDPNWQALGKQFTRQQIALLPMQWRELGYKKLRLLNQSDCKALVKHFGEPDQHRSAREFHRHNC
jgi:hypothetical protein